MESRYGWSLVALGGLMGCVAVGWVFDRFGTYAWLFMGSAAVALGAVAIAFAFPPVPRARAAGLAENPINPREEPA
jgi:hypothetical protein